MTQERFLLVGGSRGLGAAVAQHLAERVELICVSRTPSVSGRWVKADLATPAGIGTVAEAVGTQRLDALLYLGGVWENGAFTDDYSFLRSPGDETAFVLAVNLAAPIELTKRLTVNLQRSDNPRALYIGALSGLDNAATPEVANTASKFGLRGAVQAMRLALRGNGIAFTVINPGNLATEEVLEDIEAGRFGDQDPIPMVDLFKTIDCVLSMTSASEIAEIDLMQRRPASSI